MNGKEEQIFEDRDIKLETARENRRRSEEQAKMNVSRPSPPSGARKLAALTPPPLRAQPEGGESDEAAEPPLASGGALAQRLT